MLRKKRPRNEIGSKKENIEKGKLFFSFAKI
jgi:hypothetical protein